MRNLRMIKRISKLNEALPNLLISIAGYGLIALGLGLIFAQDKKSFAIGLVIGIVCAVFMAVHMAFTIDEAVSLGSAKRAQVKSVAGSVFRYAVVFMALATTAYFNIGDLPAAFIGVFALKVAAYVQPLVSKLDLRLRRR